MTGGQRSGPRQQVEVDVTVAFVERGDVHSLRGDDSLDAGHASVEYGPERRRFGGRELGDGFDMASENHEQFAGIRLAARVMHHEPTVSRMDDAAWREVSACDDGAEWACLRHRTRLPRTASQG